MKHPLKKTTRGKEEKWSHLVITLFNWKTLNDFINLQTLLGLYALATLIFFILPSVRFLVTPLES